MRQLIVYFVIVLIFTVQFSFSAFSQNPQKRIEIENLNDTCIIDGMIFKLFAKNSPQKLKAKIKNHHIKVINHEGKSCRVIRYVFSLSPYERVASLVRNYGSLVSYPVILDLQQSSIGDRFYFENIVVVNTNKEILTNSVRPLILERIK